MATSRNGAQKRKHSPAADDDTVYTTRRFTVEETKTTKDHKQVTVRLPGQVCWHRRDPWILLAGDCFFTDIHLDFRDSKLIECDCPMTVSVYGGKIRKVLDYVETVIPASVELVVVHLGANNITGNSTEGSRAALMLLHECQRLLDAKKHIKEIAICLLSNRTTDVAGKYSSEYIGLFNDRVLAFNNQLQDKEGTSRKISLIDLGLNYENPRVILRGTGFGVNEMGREIIADTLISLIFFKSCTSVDSDYHHAQLYPGGRDAQLPNSDRRRPVLRERGEFELSYYISPFSPVRLVTPQKCYKNVFPPSRKPKLARR